MKGIDDGPDGLNEAAFDRALGRPSRRSRPGDRSESSDGTGAEVSGDPHDVRPEVRR